MTNVGDLPSNAAVPLAGLASDAVARLVPAGAVLPFAGASAPTGWLICDGTTSYLKADYPALDAVLSAASYPYGSDATHFTVPDLRGRVPVGKGTHADVDTLSDSDGLAVGSRTPKHSHTVNSHSHTVDSHSHSISAPPYPDEVRSINGTGSTLVPSYDHTHGGKVGSAAPGTSSSSPGTTTFSGYYATLNYIIKAH